MSSSCIPSLLLQSLYVVSLGPESGLGTREVLDRPSSGLSGQGDLDVEGLTVSQGKEVEGRDGVDWTLISDLGASLVVELRGGDDGGAAGVGSRSSVHADLEVFGIGRGNWDSMLDFGVDVDAQSAIWVLGAIIGICTYCDPLANITSATIDRTMRTNASLCSFMPSQS